MSEFEFIPREVKEGAEKVESADRQALDDATFEPGSYVEGMGDYKQAEAIQSSLEVVAASFTPEIVPDVETLNLFAQPETSQATQEQVPVVSTEIPVVTVAPVEVSTQVEPAPAAVETDQEQVPVVSTEIPVVTVAPVEVSTQVEPAPAAVETPPEQVPVVSTEIPVMNMDVVEVAQDGSATDRQVAAAQEAVIEPTNSDNKLEADLEAANKVYEEQMTEAIIALSNAIIGAAMAGSDDGAEETSIKAAQKITTLQEASQALRTLTIQPPSGEPSDSGTGSGVTFSDQITQIADEMEELARDRGQTLGESIKEIENRMEVVANDRQAAETQFERYDQKLTHLLDTLSKILKVEKETQAAVKNIGNN